jgi:hypothetical protein
MLSPSLYFSYNQFLIYDSDVKLPGCEWTAAHSAQGFARRESVVCFSTLLEFGNANVVVSCSVFESRQEYERAIAVPFRITSGKVIVEGPDESDVDRSVAVPSGDYRLVAAQYVTGDDEEAIDLFFELLPESLKKSSVLVLDEALNPPQVLIETASIAGEE